MIKTVKDLKEALEDIIDENTPVKIWVQPHYPMEYSIRSIETYDGDSKHVVYICEGSQQNYAPSLF